MYSRTVHGYVDESYLFAIHGRLPPEQAAKAVIPSCGQRLLLMAMNKAQTENMSAAKSQHKQLAHNCMIDVGCNPIWFHGVLKCPYSTGL
jgi:hypothetical protein